jgi:hypothetical protein
MIGCMRLCINYCLALIITRTGGPIANHLKEAPFVAVGVSTIAQFISSRRIRGSTEGIYLDRRKLNHARLQTSLILTLGAEILQSHSELDSEQPTLENLPSEP